MGIRLVTFYNSTVTPQDDALIYENSLPASGMIYGGNVTIKNANTLHISAGHGALCGRKFTIEEDDIPIILTSSGTLNGRLYIHMDLSDTGEPISLQVERANSLTPVIQQTNVNINDGIYEINLATFTISTSTVSDLNYVAPFIKDLDLREVIIAPVEPSNVASSNYAIGKRLIMDKVLYKVTSAITAGQTIQPGVNVEVSDNIEKQIDDVNSSISTINGNKANQTVIATRQANLTASKAYAVGEQFIYNNILYRATAAIAKNAAITIGGNATTADNITTQISNLNWQDVPYYTSYGTILLTTKIKKNKYLCVGYVNISTYSGGAVGASFSIDAAYSQTIPMVARNSGTGVTTFVDASVSSSGMYAMLPNGYDEIRGSFVIPLT